MKGAQEKYNKHQSMSYRSLYILVVTLVPTLIHAQDKSIDSLVMEVVYHETVVTDTVTWTTVTDTTLLKIGKDCAAFYSEDLYFADSLERTPGGATALRQLQFEYARQGRISDLTSNTGEYTYLNYPDGKITVRARIYNGHVEFSEYLQPQEWELSDSTCTIKGYICFKAATEFRGRRWTAWYCPDIPVRWGPWKLNGLPGLIIEAYDSKKEYHYELVGLDADLAGEIILYDMAGGKYIHTDRIKYLRAYAGDEFIMGEFAREIDMPELSSGHRNYDSRETDYHR